MVVSNKPMNADAMAAPIKRPWCRDDKPMTPNRILQIAQSKGEFTVHRYMYRDDKMRATCQRMVANGMLKMVGQSGEFLVFQAVPKDLAV
jgi:hypothetical protein